MKAGVEEESREEALVTPWPPFANPGKAAGATRSATLLQLYRGKKKHICSRN